MTFKINSPSSFKPCMSRQEEIPTSLLFVSFFEQYQFALLMKTSRLPSHHREHAERKALWLKKRIEYRWKICLLSPVWWNFLSKTERTKRRCLSPVKLLTQAVNYIYFRYANARRQSFGESVWLPCLPSVHARLHSITVTTSKSNLLRCLYGISNWVIWLVRSQIIVFSI